MSFQSAVGCTQGEGPWGSKAREGQKSGTIVVSDCSGTWFAKGRAQQRQSVSQ